MLKQKSLTLSSFMLYVTFFFCCFALFFVGNQGEPFALALLFAALLARLNPLVCCILYAASALAGFSFDFLPLYAAQGAVLFFAFLLHRKTGEKHSVFVFIGLFIALAGFLFFAPFTAYSLPFDVKFLLSPLSQKALIAAVIYLLAAVFSIAMKGILFKLLRRRLKAEELVFSCLLVVVVGIGVCKSASVVAYLGVAYFTLLLFCLVTKDASGAVCAFVLSLPPALVCGVSPERFFVFAVAAIAFSKSGRVLMVFAFLSAFFAYAYLDGLFLLESAPLTAGILSALIPCLLFLFLPVKVVRRMENRLVFYREKHLSRVAINRNRARVGQQLFEISGVFREIQVTFSSLADGNLENGAKEYICGVITETVCKQCPRKKQCERMGRDENLKKLVDLGTAKGRTSLIDIPKELADICPQQSDLLYAANKQLGDYRKYMLEAENAKDGRNLLARQALGVSEILKNIALEQSAPLTIMAEDEKRLDVALLKAGIVCSEIMLAGEENEITLSLVSYGDADVKKIAAVATDILKKPMIISEKIPLGKEKFCCILRRRPVFDAAFGIATATKYGESASGDTHAVIKIDERRFMIALSDGMGSGEYARKISESTISLLESFYRAKMPSELILSTVNKLLSFNREETFACVDIGIVNLDTGRTDVVKIGSPMGFILSGNTLRVLDSSSLPLGILDALRPDTATYALQAGDVLLFLSDGITSAFPSTADLYETLKHLPDTNPQQIADDLLSYALSLYGGTAKDDMTVLAVRLFKNTRGGLLS